MPNDVNAVLAECSSEMLAEAIFGKPLSTYEECGTVGNLQEDMVCHVCRSCVIFLKCTFQHVWHFLLQHHYCITAE